MTVASPRRSSWTTCPRVLEKNRLLPRIFAYVVAAWLVGIILNLLLLPGYFDVALRDLGLALGALSLGQLSQKYDRR